MRAVHILAVYTVCTRRVYSLGTRKEMYSVMRFHPEFPQTSANFQAQLFKLGEALVRISAQLKVCPLLLNLGLLAIDHLLDLLSLIVSLD